MGRLFGRLGNEMESFRLNSGVILDKCSIIVKNENGDLVVGAKVQLIFEGQIKFSTTTNKNGEAILQGINGNLYELKIISDSIQEFTENFQFIENSQSEIIVSVKKYLEINPKFIWLTKSNNYTENVNVISNTNWLLI